MVCAVGLNAASASAAIRAHIARFVEVPFRDLNHRPVIAAPVPIIADRVQGMTRIVKFAAMAVAECCAASSRAAIENTPVIAAVAAPGDPGRPRDLEEEFLPRLEEALARRFRPESRLVPRGKTAVLEALALARDLLRDPGLPSCIVLGVDSLVNGEAIETYHARGRLKTEEVSDAFIPGEGAAALLVARDAQERPPTAPAIRILGLGFSQERGAITTSEPNLGIGLAKAARMALQDASLSMDEVDFLVGDVNGEQYGFREVALAKSRIARTSRRPAYRLWHCADCIGETRAALMACQLAYLYNAFAKGYAPGVSALCLSSADEGARAAAILVSRESPSTARIRPITAR